MPDCIIRSDRRRDERVESRDVARWKRPGRIEDHKAWMVDRSRSSIGFMADAAAAPRLGEVLNIRQLDRDRWTIIEDTVRVARTAPAGDDLVMVGCTFAS